MSQMNSSATPQDGWWPEWSIAPVTQMLFREGKLVANVIKRSNGWRPFSLTELNRSGTGGTLLSDTVTTREEAMKICEEKWSGPSPTS